MNDTHKDQLDRITRYANIIMKQTGKAVRPFRQDGWVNLLNKYGTSKDTSEQYHFVEEATVPDDLLETIYEGNGLFARIIDTPAEEAVKHGFELKNVNDHCIEDFYMSALDELDWDEVATTGIKWARLFGGALAVMLINDGRQLDEPVDWRNIQSIDDIRVYDRSIIQPDYSSIYAYDPRDPFGSRGSRLGRPEYYTVSSLYGTFTVHESRCLDFCNGVLPERSSQSIYQIWGMPEYVRINRAIRDAEVAHGSAVKMLDRSVQPVYKMKDLSMELATDEGENRILKRLQAIDLARGMMNTLVVDNDGEEYDFRTFQFSGVSEVVDVTCNYLSALTCIPQTILFGRAISGMSSTDDTAMENYYNMVDRIRRRMLRPNLRYLLSVIFQAGVATGEIEKVPPINIVFNPLWSMTESEQADLDLKKAQIKQTNANTSAVYMGQQVFSPDEVRKSLVKAGDFEIDTAFDDDDMTEEEMNEIIDKIQNNGGLAPSSGGDSPDAAPAATKLPQDMTNQEVASATLASQERAQQPSTGQENEEFDEEDINTHQNENYGSVGVLVIKEGRVLVGIRNHDFGNGLICGPGGHIEKDETPEFAAARETSEEFGIIPNELIFIGRGESEPEEGLAPYLYICTDFDGTPEADGDEMTDMEFLSLEDLEKVSASLFAPFAYSLKVLKKELFPTSNFDKKGKDGRWVTTRGGKRVFINEEGKPEKGNPFVVEAMNRGANGKKSAYSSVKDRERKNTDFSKKSLDNPQKQATIIVKNNIKETTGATPDEEIRSSDTGGTTKRKVKFTDYKTVNGTMRVEKDTKAKIGKSGRVTIVAGELTNVEVFAGKGGRKPLRLAESFAKEYGGKPEDWMHTTGDGRIRFGDGTEKEAEIHWFECDGIGQTEWKVKRFKKG